VRQRAIRQSLRLFLPVVGGLALLAYVLIYVLGLAPSPIRSDGWTYYAYLPSWVIFHDPTLTALARDCCGGTFPSWTAIERWPATGQWLAIHPLGEAVLMLPFFLMADALTWWSNLTRDGFSFYYQHAAGLSGVCYLVGGLWMLRRVLERRFSPGVVLATLVCTTWGTNLFHYGTFDATYSHVYAFFLCAALLELGPRWLETPSAGRSVLLGSLVAVIVLVRHINVLLPMGLACYGVRDIQTARHRLTWIRAHVREVSLALFVAALGVVPQLLVYYQATGHWIVSSYGSARGFNFAAPRILDVLVSPSKGLFFWSPVLMFSLLGVVVMRRLAPEFILPILLVIPAQVYLVASWYDWQFGASFGHRGFTDFLPLFAVAMAAGFDWIRRTRVVWLAAIVASSAVLLSVAQMLQYWVGILPMRDTSWDEYVSVFLKFAR
jgi:hypothetical protein